MEKAIFCDLGNVLVHFDIFRSIHRYVALGKRSLQDVLPEIFQTSFLSDLETGKCSARDFYRKACSLFGMRIGFDRFLFIWNDIFTENRMLSEWIMAQSARHHVYLITNTNTMHYAFLRKEYRFFRHLSGVVASHEIGLRKPDPRIFHHALCLAGVSPSHAFYLDDVQGHVDAARQCGMQAFRYIDIPTTMRDYRKFQAR